MLFVLYMVRLEEIETVKRLPNAHVSTTIPRHIYFAFTASYACVGPEEVT